MIVSTLKFLLFCVTWHLHGGLATVTLVKKVCYLRGIYFTVSKKTSIILLQLSTQTTRTNQSKVLHKLLILSINILRLLGVISYVRILNSSHISIRLLWCIYWPQKSFWHPLTMFCLKSSTSTNSVDYNQPTASGTASKLLKLLLITYQIMALQAVCEFLKVPFYFPVPFCSMLMLSSSALLSLNSICLLMIPTYFLL